MTVLIALLSSSLSLAATFAPGSSYPLKPEWKDPAPALQLPASARFDYRMSYASFEAGSKDPRFSNETIQKVRWKSLGSEKYELLFEDYRLQSKVQLLPGMAPMQTSQDFGVFLSSKPLQVSASGGQPRKIDNLEQVRSQLGSEIKDPAARQALMLTFQESTLLDTTRSFLQENSCLRDLARKKIGSSWKVQLDGQGMKLGFECRLDGWAEVNGKKVMVIAISIPKSRQETKLPLGKVATVETDGLGKLYVEPQSRESLLELEMNIAEQPTKAGQAADRARMKSSTLAEALP